MHEINTVEMDIDRLWHTAQSFSGEHYDLIHWFGEPEITQGTGYGTETYLEAFFLMKGFIEQGYKAFTGWDESNDSYIVLSEKPYRS